MQHGQTLGRPRLPVGVHIALPTDGCTAQKLSLHGGFHRCIVGQGLYTRLTKAWNCSVVSSQPLGSQSPAPSSRRFPACPAARPTALFQAGLLVLLRRRQRPAQLSVRPQTPSAALRQEPGRPAMLALAPHRWQGRWLPTGICREATCHAGMAGLATVAASKDTAAAGAGETTAHSPSASGAVK